MKLFTSTSSNLPQLQKASSNNARVGSNILTTTIFGNYKHPFIPHGIDKPTEKMLYLFRKPYPENSNISELLRRIPEWMSAFFCKRPNGEEQVTVSRGLLLPQDSWRHCQDGKVLTHRSSPLYTLIKSQAGDSLELKLPRGVHYSYETGQPSEMSWGSTSTCKKSFARIDFPTDNPKNYNLNVVHRVSDTEYSQQHQKYTPPRKVHCLSIDTNPYMPIIFYPGSFFGELVFPKTINKALKYFGIPNTATYAGYLNHFRST